MGAGLSQGQAPFHPFWDFSSQPLKPDLMLPGFPVLPQSHGPSLRFLKHLPHWHSSMLPDPVSLPSTALPPSLAPTAALDKCSAAISWLDQEDFFLMPCWSCTLLCHCLQCRLVSALLGSLAFSPGTSAPISPPPCPCSPLSLLKPIAVALPVTGGSQAGFPHPFSFQASAALLTRKASRLLLLCQGRILHRALCMLPALLFPLCHPQPGHNS